MSTGSGFENIRLTTPEKPATAGFSGVVSFLLTLDGGTLRAKNKNILLRRRIRRNKVVTTAM